MKETNKEQHRFINRGKQIVILSCISLLALLCSVWNAAFLAQGLDASTQEYCSGITSQLVDAINDGIYYKMIELENVADSLSNVYIQDSGGGIDEFLKRKAEILDFSALILLDRNGGCVAQYMGEDAELETDGLMDNPGIRKALLDEVGMGFLEGEILFYSAPVYRVTDAEYVLVGIRSKENMQSLLTTKAFYGKTLSCIVDSKGELVLSPVEIQPFNYLDNIFRDGTGGNPSQEFLQIQEDMANGRDGLVRFEDVNGGENYLAYNFLGNNDWVLLTIVPVNLISGSISGYISRSLLIIVGTSLAFLMLLLFIFRIYTDSRNQLNRIAFLDNVTGGINHKAFQMSYEKAAREEDPFYSAIVVMNIRSFKMINDKLGYAAGSEMLRYIYQVILRHLDENGGEFATRSTMDHFFLRLKESRTEEVQRRLDEIVADVNTFRDTDCPRYQVSFQIGCCMVKDAGTEIQTVQDRARIALGESSRSNECVFYNNQIASRVKREQELDDLFEEALSRHQFKVFLQPKVNLHTRRPEGAEALVRWDHPERGMISPAEFIPLFEKSGKICRLDFYVFEEVCRFYRRRMAEGKKWYPVSVNLSRYHFYEDDFLDEFDRTRREYGLPDYSIEFELTESMFFDQEHIEYVKKGIRKMHEMGYHCSMDDFGFGFSSLGLLKEFDVDTLKMDRSFFLDISSQKARDIIQSVVELAAKLKVETVAEGIEETDQMEFLDSIHCDTVQGFFFSRPLPMSEYESWVEQYEAEGGRRAVGV